MPRVALIVNPSAGGGRGRRRLAAVEDALRDRGVDFHTGLTESLEDGARRATHAVANGELPAVMSGDGMVAHIGGVLAGTGAAMAVVPGGRGNDLARVLGIPSDPAGAVAVLDGGEAREIDVGEVNGRRFLGIASAGYDSDANTIANEAKLVKGQLVYAYAAIRALIRWRPAAFDVVVDGEALSFRGYSVAAANSKAFGGGMFLAPDAELDDGRLDVVLTGESSKLHFVRSLPKVFKGTHVSEPQITVLRGRHVEFRSDRPFAVFADGESLSELPATVTVLPRALRVMAPRTSP